MITLIAFYKKLNLDKESSEVKEATSNFDYHNAIQCLRQTFLRFNPGNKFLVTTDSNTELPLINSEICRLDITECNLMEAIVKRDTYVAKHFTGNLMLVGADHLIVNSVEKLFNGDFDIGILFNGDNVNNTVVLLKIKDSNRQRIVEFFDLRQNEFYKLNQKEIDWFGDQRSIEILLEKLNIKHEFKKQYVSSNGLKFKFLHYGEDEICGAGKSKPKFNKNAVLIDFKGIRKQWFSTIYSILNQKK